MGFALAACAGRQLSEARPWSRYTWLRSSPTPWSAFRPLPDRAERALPRGQRSRNSTAAATLVCDII